MYVGLAAADFNCSGDCTRGCISVSAKPRSDDNHDRLKKLVLTLCRPAFPQADSRPAAVLIDKLDAGGL